MRRTPEPELMDSAPQALAYARADFSITDHSFAQTILSLAASDPITHVADLGCGPGNIALRLAKARPSWQLTGYDGAAEMIKLAQAQALPNTQFITASLPLLEPTNERFDAIVSNSLLHHLHDPQTLWRTILAIGKPGALVVIQDLRRPATPATAQALVAQYAQDAPEVLRQDFLASLHAAFEPDEVHAQLELASLDDFSVTEQGDRHLLITGTLPA